MYSRHKGCCYKTALFQSDPDEPDKITAEGMMRFLDDVQLHPESRTVLALAWKFKAATQCEFTKDEFTNGMAELQYVD